MALKDGTLDQIHEALATELVNRIKNGTATAADLNVARQFLKDNNFGANPGANKPLRDLAAEVPFHEDTEEI